MSLSLILKALDYQSVLLIGLIYVNTSGSATCLACLADVIP